MAGNIKHGFMRGNAAGRNGSGIQKGFYCDACEKQHGNSVERTGLKHLLGNDIVICERKYFSMKDDELKCKTTGVKAIAKLKCLKKKTSLEADAGLKARIEFVCTVFNFDLKEPLVRYQLFDQYHIGERDFDFCFEMYDGDLVVHGVIKQAKKKYWLKRMLKKSLGAEGYDHWIKTFERVEQSAQHSIETTIQAQQVTFAF